MTRRQLLDQGIPTHRIDSAVRSGRLRVIRRGWYAGPGANADAVEAVRVGGSLTCGRALAQYGVWVVPEPTVHVVVPGRASRLRPRKGAVIHWSRSAGARPIESPADALLHLAECSHREAAVAAIDSARNLRLVSMAQLTETFAGASAKARLRLELSDETAQSGLETFARLRLRRLRIRHRTQVWIDGVGRVDMLVGERLVVELDGFAFHTREAFEEDRRRDLVLHGLGFRVLRVSYRQLMGSWDQVEAALLTMVRRGDHRELRQTKTRGRAGRTVPPHGPEFA